METESLFYKEHKIDNKDIVVIFHKDVTYLLNESTPNPVVKFTLTNCRNVADLKFDNINYYNDGVIIDIGNESALTFFRAIDMSGIATKILCDKVIREDLKYRQPDLIDIIKSTKKESDNNNDTTVMLYDRINTLTNSLKHDLDIIDRKLAEANWLTNDKRQFLEGQKNTIQNVLQLIDKKAKQNLNTTN